MITMLMQTALISAFAATSPQADDGWMAYSGCWRAENAPSTSLVCFVPDGAGVRMLEIDNGVTRETRIISDGKQRPLTVEGCTGEESSHWSADDARLLLSSAMTCGDRTQRKTSGIFAFVQSNSWVSIKAVTVGKQGAATTTHYFEVAASQVPASVAAALPNNRLARETARYAASDQLDLDDVREALSQVEPRAVEALILARQQPFDLNGKRLVALADAGVPDYVIDAIVASSHPEAFEIRPASQAVATAPEDRTLDPYDRYDRDRCRGYTAWSVYDRYGCRYGYDDYSYMRAAQMGYGGYSPWGYYNPPVIVIRNGNSEPATNGGKAGKNGYSRGNSTGSDRAKSRDSGTASTSKPSSSSTPSTTSSGSSSSSSGRTAKPRDK